MHEKFQLWGKEKILTLFFSFLCNETLKLVNSILYEETEHHYENRILWVLFPMLGTKTPKYI